MILRTGHNHGGHRVGFRAATVQRRLPQSPAAMQMSQPLSDESIIADLPKRQDVNAPTEVLEGVGVDAVNDWHHHVLAILRNTREHRLEPSCRDLPGKFQHLLNNSARFQET